jgi:hypothetical protein
VFVTPKDGWTADAAMRPLGAYYRITHDAIADLQAAIVEVGAIYASGCVHDGWQDPGREIRAGTGAVQESRAKDVARTGARARPASLDGLPTIAWGPTVKAGGGHAFALVGYDDEGFIVQNSWGPDWGFHGFARLAYADWLANGMDAWVATLGAPIKGEAPTIVLSSGRTVPDSAAELGRGLAGGITVGAVAAATGGGVWNMERAARHALVLGNDGRLAAPILVDAADAAAAATRVVKALPSAWLASAAGGSGKVVLYVHGGLNDLRTALARVRVLGPCFHDNDVYPIFACWQSGFIDSLKNALEDTVSGIFGADPRMRQAQGFFDEAKDRALEVFAIPAARPIWQQMKQNALAASDAGGGIKFMADRLAELAREHPSLELHLVGHSAGAIALAPLLEILRSRKIKVGSLSLYAPACTVDLANATFANHIGTTVPADKVSFDILDDARERDDAVGPYGKSLLYLVSRALEAVHKTPILGLEAVWEPTLDASDLLASARPGRQAAVTAAAAAKPPPSVERWRRFFASAQGARLKVLEAPQVSDGEKAISANHGCFDNWQGCVAATIERIRGGPLKAPLLPLVGF